MGVESKRGSWARLRLWLLAGDGLEGMRLETEGGAGAQPESHMGAIRDLNREDARIPGSISGSGLSPSVLSWHFSSWATSSPTPAPGLQKPPPGPAVPAGHPTQGSSL